MPRKDPTCVKILYYGITSHSTTLQNSQDPSQHSTTVQYRKYSTEVHAVGNLRNECEARIVGCSNHLSHRTWHRLCPRAFGQLLSRCLPPEVWLVSHLKTAKKSRTVKKSG